jgi:2-keto-4-pentenoate hydratase
LWVNGKVSTKGKGENALGDPLRALTWLANALPSARRNLRAGEIINTGTCTPLVQGRPGDEVRATFGELGEVRVGFER